MYWDADFVLIKSQDFNSQIIWLWYVESVVLCCNSLPITQGNLLMVFILSSDLPLHNPTTFDSFILSIFILYT